MDLDMIVQCREEPTKHHDMDVVNTLATMAGSDSIPSIKTTHEFPLSPAWSHSSLESDGTNESMKSDPMCSTDGSSGYPSPMTRCSAPRSFSGSFSSESSLESLPRIPELDHISLETLATHYANSAAVQSPNHSRSVPSLSPLTPKTFSGFNPLPPMAYPSPISREADYSKPKRRPAARGTRCNVKYTIEQKDFIDYWRIDRHDRETAWEEVVREYNVQFKGPHRREGGLQSAYYRENKKIPIADAEGLLVFDENDEIKTVEVPVREAKGRLHSVKSIGLLSTHPERAIEYPWVSKEHKRQVWRVGHARKEQLEAAAKRQRKRSELEAQRVKAQEGYSPMARTQMDIEPFEAPLMQRPIAMRGRY